MHGVNVENGRGMSMIMHFKKFGFKVGVMGQPSGVQD